MKDIIITIFILLIVSAFAISSFILAQNKDEVWNEIRKRFIDD